MRKRKLEMYNKIILDLDFFLALYKKLEYNVYKGKS